MATSVTQLVQAANAVVPRIAAAQAQDLIAAGGALVVDVREAAEVQQSGKVSGAVHVPRGLLEFVGRSPIAFSRPTFRDRQAGDPVLRWGRTGGARRAGAQGTGLRRGLQPRRVRRLGGQRRGDRHLGSSGREAADASLQGLIEAIQHGLGHQVGAPPTATPSECRRLGQRPVPGPAADRVPGTTAQ